MPASEAKTSRIETLIRQLQGRTARDILYGSGLSAASFGGGVALTAAIPHGRWSADGAPAEDSREGYAGSDAGFAASAVLAVHAVRHPADGEL
jgi:hypothetical protein